MPIPALSRRALLLWGAAAVCIPLPPLAFAGDRFPPPRGRAGDPFEDPNLKLVVLNALLETGHLDLCGDTDDLAEHVLRRAYDFEEEGYELTPEVLAYLYRYPLTPELLSKVEYLPFDGGNEIYAKIWPFWDGETDDFDVGGFGGITNCPNIKTLDMHSMVHSVDIADLAGLSTLEELGIGVGVTNLESLRDLPTLRKLSIYNDRVYDDVVTPGSQTRRVMEDLKARGVEVLIHWVTRVGDVDAPAFR